MSKAGGSTTSDVTALTREVALESAKNSLEVEKNTGEAIKAAAAKAKQAG